MKRLILAALFFQFSFLEAAPLSGTYTICASGCSYSSFTSAVSDLTTNGVSAAVTFNVGTGNYNEAITIGSISGVSSTNTITFKGAGAGNTKIYNALSSASAVVYLNNTTYVSLIDMTIEYATSSPASNHYSLYAYYSNYCNFTDCRVFAPILPGSTPNIYTIYQYYCNNNTFKNNYIRGGYNTMYNYQVNNSNYINNRIMSANAIIFYNYYGIKNVYDGNFADSMTIGSTPYVSYFESGASYINNKTYGTNAYNGFYCYSANYGSTVDKFVIENNLFNCQYKGAARGIMIYQPNGPLSIKHNTVRIKSPGSTAGFAFQLLNPTYAKIDLRNNNFERDDSLPVASLGDPAKYSNLDGNNYRNAKEAKTKVEFNSINYNSFSLYKSAVSAYGLGQNETDFESHFLNENDLHYDTNYFNPLCQSAGVTRDVDGDLRGPVFTACGADEWRSDLNLIRGKYFFDRNHDKVPQQDEFVLPELQFEKMSNNPYIFTNNIYSGSFEVVTDTGKYFLKPFKSKYIKSVNPVSYTVDFKNKYGNMDTNCVFVFDPIGELYDLSLGLTANKMETMSGLKEMFTITYTNNGTSTVDGKIYFLKDSRYTKFYSEKTGYTTKGDTISWDIKSIKPYSYGNLKITMTTDTAVKVGQVLKNLVWITMDSTDFYSKDNKDSSEQTVRGRSKDPNDKSVRPDGDISPDFLKKSEYLDYAIRFQNTGNDTAYKVEIFDTLSPYLNFETFEMISASHTYKHRYLGDGVVKWWFPGVKLPDSIINEPESHGFVRYRIKPYDTIALKTQIKNKASIFFDANGAVVTNETVTTVACPQNITQINMETCDSFKLNGITYKTSGTYTQQYSAANKCDSIVKLNLVINNSYSNTITSSVCFGDSVFFGGKYLKSSGTYSNNLHSTHGCDSILTMKLTVNSPSSSSSNVSTCNNYLFGGKTLTKSGTYYDTLTNAVGCDSIITLNLTINTVNNAVSLSGKTLTATESGATYQWLDCSNGNKIISGATGQSYSPTLTGDYACIITKNSCTDTSNCVNVVVTGTNELRISNYDLRIYPNPTTGIINLEFSSPIKEDMEVKVYDIMGQVCLTKRIESNTQTKSIDVSGKAKGVYLIECVSGDGVVRERVVVE